jgi:serine/threonine protein kinase
MIIDNKYYIIGYLGKGEFGYVYKAQNIRTNEYVALKSEPANHETKLLKNEATIYHYLVKDPGFPKVKYYGLYNDRYYMAIDLLGPSLTAFMKHRKQTLQYEEIKGYSNQMFDRVETVHKKGLIHRDIKPDNFMFGINTKHETLHLIDFGFCKPYLIPSSQAHIPFRNNRTPLGTTLFMSLHVIQGVEPSRRDDLESVFYCMLFLYNPDLFTNVKNYTEIKTLHQISVPPSWKTLHQTIQAYAYDQTPDYDSLRQLL